MRRLRTGAGLRRALERIGERDLEAGVFGMTHDAALSLYRPELTRVLNDAGLPRVWYLHGRNAGLELLRLLRTRRGRDLGREIELLVRKWQNLGFEPGPLAGIVLGVLARTLVAPLAPPRVRPAAKPKPRAGKRARDGHGYRAALEQGRVALNARGDVAAQVARHEAGTARNRAVSRLVRDILAAHGIPGREFIRYNAFAYRVDRLARRRGDKSLRRAIDDLVDRYEARGFDPLVLSAIERAVIASTARTDRA